MFATDITRTLEPGVDGLHTPNNENVSALPGSWSLNGFVKCSSSLKEDFVPSPPVTKTHGKSDGYECGEVSYLHKHVRRKGEWTVPTS